MATAWASEGKRFFHLVQPVAHPAPGSARPEAPGPAFPPADDPELEILKPDYRADFEEAFREAFAAMSPRARNLLRLRYLEGVGVGELGSVYAVHRTTVTRWLAEAEEELLGATRRLLRDRLRLSPTECDSLIRMVQSRIELTMSSLLRTMR